MEYVKESEINKVWYLCITKYACKKSEVRKYKNIMKYIMMINEDKLR